MGGMRTAGDLVMRLQLAKKMKIAKRRHTSAEKLGVSLEELCDVVTMSDKREELGLGLAHVEPCAKPMPEWKRNSTSRKFWISRSTQ